jgi:hypothetical protein
VCFTPSISTVPALGSMRWSRRRLSRFHSGCRGDHGALGLELHDREGLLHAGHDHGVAPAIALRLEVGGRIVGVGLAHQPLEGRRHDPVALFELRGAAVAGAETQHREDAWVVAEVGAQPDHVVVAPEQVAVGLAHERVDDLVDARAAVAEVAGHQQLVDREGADEASAGTHGAPITVVHREAGDHLADVVRSSGRCRVR